MKFALYIDYKKNGLDYRVMEAKTLEEAIEEAEKLWNSEEHFLMRIMKKVGKIEKEDDFKVETFKAVLCKRSHGWHLNNEENSESEHFAKRYYTNTGFENFEIVSIGTYEF